MASCINAQVNTRPNHLNMLIKCLIGCSTMEEEEEEKNVDQTEIVF